jgi:hypothetical protein
MKNACDKQEIIGGVLTLNYRGNVDYRYFNIKTLTHSMMLSLKHKVQ